MDDFHNTIDAVYAWVEKNSNWGETRLILTAGHETGFLSGCRRNAGLHGMSCYFDFG
jgi:hypothetical protein